MRFLCVHRRMFGKRHVRALLRDPRQMARGKKTPNLLAFALDFVVSPRSCGHQGILIFHCTFDRAPFQSLSTMLTQYYTFMAPLAGADEGEDGRGAKELYLLFWFLKTSCTHHDVQKAFEWSMFEEFGSGELMDEVYIGIAACCNSAIQIVGEMEKWLWRALAPHP